MSVALRKLSSTTASIQGPHQPQQRADHNARVDSNGTQSHVSVFDVDQDGNLALRGAATLNSSKINGMAIVSGRDNDRH